MPLFSVVHHDNETSLFSSECTVGALNTALLELSLPDGNPSFFALYSPLRVSSPGGMGGGKASSTPLGAPGEKSSGSSSTAGVSSGFHTGSENIASVAAGSRAGSGTMSGSASSVAKSKRISGMAGQARSLLDLTAGRRSGGAMFDVLQNSKTNTHFSAPKSSSRSRSTSPANGVSGGGGGGGGGRKKGGSVDEDASSAAASARGSEWTTGGYRSPAVSVAQYRKLELIPLTFLNDLLNNPKLPVALQTAVTQREQQQQQQQPPPLGLAGAATVAGTSTAGAGENGVNGGVGVMTNMSVYASGPSSSETSPCTALPNTVSFTGSPTLNASGGGGVPTGSSVPSTTAMSNASLLSLLHSIPFVGLMTLPVHNSVLDTFTANTSYILLGCREKESDGRGNAFPALSGKRSSFFFAGGAPTAATSFLSGALSGSPSGSPHLRMEGSEGGGGGGGRDKKVRGNGSGAGVPPATFLPSSPSSSPAGAASHSPRGLCATAPPSSSPQASCRDTATERRHMPPLSASLSSIATVQAVRTGSQERKGCGGTEGIPMDVHTTVEPFRAEMLRSAGYGRYVVEHCGGHRLVTPARRMPISTLGKFASAADRSAVRESKREGSLGSSIFTVPSTQEGGRGGGATSFPSSRQGEGTAALPLGKGYPVRMPQLSAEHAASSMHSVATSRASEGMGAVVPSHAGTSVRGLPLSSWSGRAPAPRVTEVMEMIQMSKNITSPPVSRAALQAVTLVPFLGASGGMGVDESIFPVRGAMAGGGQVSLLSANTPAGKSSTHAGVLTVPGTAHPNPSSSPTTKKGDRSGRHGSGVSLEENTVQYGPRRLLTKDISPLPQTPSPSSASLLPTGATLPVVVRSHGSGGHGIPGENGGTMTEEGGSDEGPHAHFPTTTPPPAPLGGVHESAAGHPRRRSSNKELSGRGGREGRSGGEHDSFTPQKNSARSKAGGGGGDAAATASPLPSSGNSSARGGNNASVGQLSTPYIQPILGEGEDGEPLQWEVHPEVPLSSAACGLLYQSPLTFTVSMNSGAVNARNASGAARRNQTEDHPRNALAMLLSNNPDDGIITTLSATAVAAGTGSGGGGGMSVGSGGGGQGSSSGAAGGGNSAGPGTGNTIFPSGGSGVKTHILERMEGFDVLWRGSSGEHEILAWLLQEYLKLMKTKIAAINQQAMGSSSSGTDEIGKKDSKRRKNGSVSTSKTK